MKTHFDVAIIGGGIIGSSIAFNLAKEQVNVALLEAGEIGGKATRAAAGMLGAHSECADHEVFFPFARKSQHAYYDLQVQIKNYSGIDIQLRHGGTFILAYSEDEKKQLSANALPTIEWYDREQVLEKEPSVTDNLLGAAYIEDDVNVHPYLTCFGFSKSAQMLGASIFEHTHVHDIQKQGCTFIINTTAGKLEADFVVISNGVWSSSFFGQLGLHHRLAPVKGECLSVKAPDMMLNHTLFHDHNYIVPRNNGELVIGATMVANDWSESPTIGGLETLIKKAKKMLPGITNMKIGSTWAGIRPQTFDGNPFIGRHPELDGILFATGHFRNGILLAPATGEMIRDLILGKEVNRSWLDAFRVDRFAPVPS